MYANTSQIGNPTPCDEAISQFKENSQENLENVGVHFKADASYTKPYEIQLSTPRWHHQLQPNSGQVLSQWSKMALAATIDV